MNLKKLIDPNKKLTLKDWYIPAKLFGVLLGIFFFIFLYPNPSDGEEIIFEIPRGSSFSKVSKVLHDEGIIPSEFNFKLAAFLYGAENKLKAGRYSIPSGVNYFELLDYLLKGGTEEQVLVTIPEGIWQHNLAGLLHTKLNIDSSDFMDISKNKYFLAKLGVNAKTIEGYLLPETYYFYTNSTTKEIITKLFNEMSKIFDAQSEKRMKELGMNKHQILTLASIIEAESNIPSEYKKISGVYHNRLKKWMPLEACPTIQYLKRFRKHNRIFYKDLEIDSPYNTYKNYGLPPTPINNPGIEAIMAALYPEEHDYLYFVADGTGSHRYGKTYKEHLQYVRDYRIWRANQ